MKGHSLRMKTGTPINDVKGFEDLCDRYENLNK